MRVPALLIALLLAAAPGARAAGAAPLLVTAPWVKAHLHDPDLVVLHSGSEADYAAGHIPGARLVKRDGLAIGGPAAGGLSLELPPEPLLRAQLQALGVSDRTRIVVYAAEDEVQGATRIMYTLDAAGLGARASLLDGGMAAWRRAGGAASQDAPPPATPGALAPLKMHPNEVGADAIAAHLHAQGFKVVDARAGVFYSGEQPGGVQLVTPPRKGHIPGAVSVPYSSVTGADHRFKSSAELRALFASAGVKRGDEVAVYCHVGQQATAVQFAARLAGIDAKLYDGSFQDWSRRQLPLEDPSAAGK